MKRFLIITILFLVSLSAWPFEYAGVGFGPNMNLSGGRPSNFFVQGEWQPHKIVGTKLFLGVNEGFWIGAALNFRQNITKIGHGTVWDANFSIPLIFNIKSNSRIAYVGVTAGTSFSFDIDGKSASYFFITPVDILYTPWGWVFSPTSGGGWGKNGSVSCICSVGFRFVI